MKRATRSIFIVFSFLFLAFHTFSQEKGALSLEIGGVGGLGSLSYSKSFKRFEKLNLEYRVGASFVPIDKNNGTVIVIPTLVHATYGSNQHMADLGVGHALSITTRGNVYTRLPLSFGYRFQSSGRMFYRIAYTPIVSYVYNFQWEHWAGVTFGVNLGSK